MSEMTPLPPRRRPRPAIPPSPEELFLDYGGNRPPSFGLTSATSRIGGNARAAVGLLLEQIELDGPMASHARNILASCAEPQRIPLHWPDLMGLQHAYWLAVCELLSYVRRAGPLSQADFEDRGERFCRLVLGPREAPAGGYAG